MARNYQGGRCRSEVDDIPTLRVQFHAPVHFRAIRGPYFFSVALEAPVICWGRDGHCFAYLHDFTPEARERVMDMCAEATHARRRPWGPAP